MSGGLNVNMVAYGKKTVVFDLIDRLGVGNDFSLLVIYNGSQVKINLYLMPQGLYRPCYVISCKISLA